MKDEKRCPSCDTSKSISEFGKDKSRPDKLCLYCKSCKSIKKRAYRRKYKEVLLEREKKYREENRDSLRERRKGWKDYGLNGKYARYKRGAKKRNYSFELSLDEFSNLITDANCYLCGRESSGVDRLDNSIGYVLENCKPCCGSCNKMKSDKSLDEFLDEVKLIASRH